MSQEVVLPVYSALVHSQLEICVQAGFINLLGGVQTLERFQKVATSLIQSLRRLSDKDCPKYLKLFSLERFRSRKDLIQVFKMLNRDIGKIRRKQRKIK